MRTIFFSNILIIKIKVNTNIVFKTCLTRLNRKQICITNRSNLKKPAVFHTIAELEILSSKADIY